MKVVMPQHCLSALCCCGYYIDAVALALHTKIPTSSST